MRALAERRTVLVVDDEPKIAEVVCSYLRKAGYEPVVAADGAGAIRAAARCGPALVILDLMLPDMPGEEVCRRLRLESRVPIIMLTAKVEDADAVRGLTTGADDYVTKPFSPRQLMARVAAVLRRSAGSGAAAPALLSFGGGELVVDLDARVARRSGAALGLTPREFAILAHLASSPGRCFTREELIARALGDDFGGFDRTVDAHVKNLRQKIEPDPHSPRYVVTVHGIGYRFEPPEAP